MEVKENNKNLDESQHINLQQKRTTPVNIL